MTDFKNDSTQAERRRLLTNDRPQTSSLLDHVEPEGGGRFAELARRDAGKPTVVGATPSVQYPAGPGWTRDEVPQEPPLGFCVNDLEPTGEPFEVERSLTKLAASPGAPSVSSSTASVETGDAANPALKRRKLR